MFLRRLEERPQEPILHRELLSAMYSAAGIWRTYNKRIFTQRCEELLEGFLNYLDTKGVLGPSIEAYTYRCLYSVIRDWKKENVCSERVEIWTPILEGFRKEHGLDQIGYNE